ncbi:hypothetical protein [Leptolyngbya ohadii]|uniref:hypothetical protein n=1 Tax=Leptolyngbya ohadii TaxID=1962290 RepID=UPI000B59DABE|nr:hypothetical protein [Leptolyngbya ohadii]
MAEGGMQVCPVCGVKILKIIGGDRVLFTAGPPGTREILWKKVCQYTDKPSCINRDRGAAL